MLPLIVIAHLALLFSSRVHSTATASHDEPYRVVLMSDTHVIGPQYVPGTESNPVDNESILKTPRRLREVGSDYMYLIISTPFLFRWQSMSTPSTQSQTLPSLWAMWYTMRSMPPPTTPGFCTTAMH